MAGKKFLFSLRVVQQRLAQPRPWGHLQVGEFTAFDNLALFQQRRVVTDGFHHLQLVRNQHNGQAQALIDFAQQAEDRLRGFGVQRRGGFIANGNAATASKPAKIRISNGRS